MYILLNILDTFVNLEPSYYELNKGGYVDFPLSPPCSLVQMYRAQEAFFKSYMSQSNSEINYFNLPINKEKFKSLH